MTVPRCQGTVTNRWGYAGRCWRVGTVTVNGRLIGAAAVTWIYLVTK